MVWQNFPYTPFMPIHLLSQGYYQANISSYSSSSGTTFVNSIILCFLSPIKSFRSTGQVPCNLNQGPTQSRSKRCFGWQGNCTTRQNSSSKNSSPQILHSSPFFKFLRETLSNWSRYSCDTPGTVVGGWSISCCKEEIRLCKKDTCWSDEAIRRKWLSCSWRWRSAAAISTGVGVACGLLCEGDVSIWESWAKKLDIDGRRDRQRMLSSSLMLWSISYWVVILLVDLCAKRAPKAQADRWWYQVRSDVSSKICYQVWAIDAMKNFSRESYNTRGASWKCGRIFIFNNGSCFDELLSRVDHQLDQIA